MSTIGLWHITQSGPQRLAAAGIEVERDLEDWLELQPSLLEHGLVMVGRQLRLDAGPLDLLALDPQGRWVLIEVKRGRLRRDVIAQAIDYASCLSRVHATWLRDTCNAYLKRQNAGITLEALLEQRGRSLEEGVDERDILIYVVGTGTDAGLERMVDYLAERADLAVRVVSFEAFRSQDGQVVLAREIHESGPAAPGVDQRVARPSVTLEQVLALADANGVGQVARTLTEAAVEVGFYSRPYARSIMFTPPTNKARCLFAVWVERRERAPGVAKGYVSAEAFEQFYGIARADLEEAIGPTGDVTFNPADAARVVAGLRQLLHDEVFPEP